MTDIAAAARATRKHFFTWHGLSYAEVWQVFVAKSGTAASGGFHSEEDAKAVCDRLNLLAVLEALRETSDGMVAAGVHRARIDQIPGHVLAVTWRTMIDALIAEVAENGDANDDG